jgi:hypothetical protein
VQKRILVTGQFQCAEGTNNLAASQRLRQAMLDRFGEMVRPIDGARVEIDLEFQGFAGKLGKKGAEVPPPDDRRRSPGPSIRSTTTAAGGNGMTLRVGVLTGGGDAPGLNAAICGLGRRLLAAGAELIGFATAGAA